MTERSGQGPARLPDDCTWSSVHPVVPGCPHESGLTLVLRVASGHREQPEKKFSLFHCPSPKGALAPCSGSPAIRVGVSQSPRGPVCRPQLPFTHLPAVSRGRTQAGPCMDDRGEPVSPTLHHSLQRVIERIAMRVLM